MRHVGMFIVMVGKPRSSAHRTVGWVSRTVEMGCAMVQKIAATAKRIVGKGAGTGCAVM